MAVAFDAKAEVTRTGTTSPQTWTHTPVGTPSCILMYAIHGTSSTDHVTAATYGGVTMTKRVGVSAATAEPGCAALWVLSPAFANGAAIPTGAQTVSVTCGATTDDIWFVSLSFTGNGPVTIFGAVLGPNTVQTNPGTTYDGQGRATILSVAGIYSGLDLASGLTLVAGNTLVSSVNFAGGTFCGAIARQTTPGTGSFNLGWTAASDDVAGVYVMLAEAVDVNAFPAMNIMPQLLAQ